MKAHGEWSGTAEMPLRIQWSKTGEDVRVFVHGVRVQAEESEQWVRELVAEKLAEGDDPCDAPGEDPGSYGDAR